MPGAGGAWTESPVDDADVDPTVIARYCHCELESLLELLHVELGGVEAYDCLISLLTRI